MRLPSVSASLADDAFISNDASLLAAEAMSVVVFNLSSLFVVVQIYAKFDDSPSFSSLVEDKVAQDGIGHQPMLFWYA